jgi:hypothetical protein
MRVRRAVRATATRRIRELTGLEEDLKTTDGHLIKGCLAWSIYAFFMKSDPTHIFP